MDGLLDKLIAVDQTHARKSCLGFDSKGVKGRLTEEVFLNVTYTPSEQSEEMEEYATDWYHNEGCPPSLGKIQYFEG